MPADDGLASIDYEMILPAWPESRERNPESTIQRAQSRSRLTLCVHRKLLTQGKLDDCLFFTAPEEGDDAVKERDQQDEQRPHGSRMVLDCVG